MIDKFLNRIVIFRRRAYKSTFDNMNGKRVLADLRRFCGATTPSADVNNPYATYVQEGRREVWLRIMAHLNLTEEEVFELVEDYDDE